MWLISSKQAISTTRWPEAGSRPVVSVSSTTSRMTGTPSCRSSAPRPPPRQSDHAGERPQARAAVEPGWDNEVRPLLLDGIGRLTRQDCRHALRRHPGPVQNAPGLDEARRAHDDNEIAALLASGFE